MNKTSLAMHNVIILTSKYMNIQWTIYNNCGQQLQHDAIHVWKGSCDQDMYMSFGGPSGTTVVEVELELGTL